MRKNFEIEHARLLPDEKLNNMLYISYNRKSKVLDDDYIQFVDRTRIGEIIWNFHKSNFEDHIIDSYNVWESFIIDEKFDKIFQIFNTIVDDQEVDALIQIQMNYAIEKKGLGGLGVRGNAIGDTFYEFIREFRSSDDIMKRRLIATVFNSRGVLCPYFLLQYRMGFRDLVNLEKTSVSVIK